MSIEAARVLFICVHNSARSQMAEAYLKSLGGDHFQVESAGFTPSQVNPLVIEAMAEEGIDLSGKGTQSVFELFRQGQLYNYVITVCDDSENQCPVFPGIARRLHWPFPDPASLEGSHQDKLTQVRVIRDKIKAKIETWLKSLG